MSTRLLRNLFLTAWVTWGATGGGAGPATAADAEVPKADPGAQIAQWIQQLGHENYVLREEAQEELQRVGLAALEALAQAQYSDDIEIEMRARYLMSVIKIQWTVDTDPKHVRDLMTNYATLNDEQRLAVITRLSDLGGSAAIDALGRIIRFDSSPIISKQAALGLMDMNVAEQAWETHAAAIGRNLAHSRVSAAEWLRVFVRQQNDAKAAIEPWKKLVEAERALWKNGTGRTNWQIVQSLLFRLIACLEKAGRPDDTEEYMRQIVELQPEDAESIKKLVHWLNDKRAVRVVLVVAEKYPDIFQKDPLLLYALAHAQQQLDQQEAADKSVAEAQQLNPSLPQHHLVIAYQLQERGWFEWAEQEYRMVIRITGMRHQLALRATFLLSEMLHDQQQDQRAGEVLQDLVQQMDRDREILKLIHMFEREVGSIRSRMHFFFACQHDRQGETTKQLQQLDLALAADPTDADVLIAHYRLPNASAARRKRTEQAIDRAIHVFRAKIAATPEDASPYNQFAWLVGNTLGEEDPALADEAIAKSHKSLKLRPNAAGYLDTLGRCYYARGNYPEAVYHQRRAVQLDPHSGLIRRQLELFERKLAESEGGEDAG
ncbi:MAG: tetratricopeptide repeat protein [Planctomycetales bacterium]|nr:tetratricopeptide repeat protein [Planctomycetales bacterium]NIM09757.1 tetratricopeptide repeat protein [Planctomycetales bacterium]NIN08282.1 tetratricopeptide repeat protein [Planctomycetales bacterium]NIN77411.1 tetratricopeptide repeat protein [Planctomycetales bacterium]NIO35019.1 tetratricopeptide repeat protein [Planctomycetales bacterium]